MAQENNIDYYIVEWGPKAQSPLSTFLNEFAVEQGACLLSRTVMDQERIAWWDAQSMERFGKPILKLQRDVIRS